VSSKLIKVAKGLAENWPAIMVIMESSQVYKSGEFRGWGQ